MRKTIKWSDNPRCYDCGRWGIWCRAVSVEEFVNAKNCQDFHDIRDHDTEVHKDEV